MKILRIKARITAILRRLRVIVDYRTAKIDTHLREILEKASVSLAVKLAGTCLNFGMQVLLARMLGADGVGIYYLSLAIVTFSAIVARLGMDYNVTRVVAMAEKPEELMSAARFLTNAITACVVASLLTTAVLLAASGWLANSVFSKQLLEIPLRVMALGILPFALAILFSRALQGRRATGKAMALESAAIPLFAIGLITFLVPRYQEAGAAAAFVVAAAATATLGAVWWFGQAGRSDGVRQAVPAERISTFLLNSTPLLGVLLAQQAAQVVPLLVLGAFGTEAEAGIYYASYRTAALVGVIVIAVNSIVAPKVASFFSQKETGELDKMIRSSAMLATIAALPFIVVFVAAPSAVMWVFGDEFSRGSHLLRILALGQLISVATGTVSYVLMMTNRNKSMLATTLFMLAVNAVLSFGLIPGFGATGAAWAATISLGAAGLLRVALVRYSLGVLALPVPVRFLGSGVERKRSRR